MNRVLELWDEYDRIISEYANKSLPEPIEFPCRPTSCEGDNYKIYREKVKEVNNQNQQIYRVRYIIENKQNIETVSEYLNIRFGVSKTEIRKNISFYDRIFQLSLDTVGERVTYFIDLFGSKELFLEAMFTGTPLTETIGYKEFCGIMNYKNENIENKLTALANELELCRSEAAKIFVYHSTYMYCSPQALSKSLEYLCGDLKVSKKELGTILMKCPSLIYNNNKSLLRSEIRDTIRRLKEVFFLSKEEALKVIRYYPRIVKCFWQSICELAEEKNEYIPEIICKKPWLYNLYEIANYYNGYGYGDYNKVLEYFKYLEKYFGKIINVYFRNMQPLTEAYKEYKGEILYTVILLQLKDNPDTYLFVSFGSGYKTANNYFMNLILKSIFGKGLFSELINIAPAPNNPEHNTVLDGVFRMCSIGDNGIDTPTYDFGNGNSLIIDELDDALKQLPINEFEDICSFKTVRMISTEEAKRLREQQEKNSDNGI